MNIEEAYQAMLKGHKVAHESYTEDEFNFMEGAQIRCEQGYYWGLKGDTAWQIRIQEEWAQEGWFICDERELKPKRLYKFQSDIVWDQDKFPIRFMPANREATLKIETHKDGGFKSALVHLGEPIEEIEKRVFKALDIDYSQKTAEQMFGHIKKMTNEDKALRPEEIFLLSGSGAIGKTPQEIFRATVEVQAMSPTTELTARDLTILANKIKESNFPNEEEVKQFNKKLLAVATPEEFKIISESIGVPKEYKFADPSFLSAMEFDYHTKEIYKNNKDGSMGFTVKKNRNLNKKG